MRNLLLLAKMWRRGAIESALLLPVLNFDSMTVRTMLLSM